MNTVILRPQIQEL